MLDPSGNVILDSSGNVQLDDGSGNSCCCDQLYQARNCSDNTLASLYVHKSQFPSWPSTYYFKSGSTCYYAAVSDAVSSGTPVVSGETSTGGGCGCYTCTKCGNNFCGDGTAPGRLLVTLSGLSVPTSCTQPTGTAGTCSFRRDFAWLGGDTASGSYTVPFLGSSTGSGGVVECIYQVTANVNTATFYGTINGTCGPFSNLADRLTIRISVLQSIPTNPYYGLGICRIDVGQSGGSVGGTLFEASFTPTCTGPLTLNNNFGIYAGCNHPVDMYDTGSVGNFIVASGGTAVITGQAFSC